MTRLSLRNALSAALLALIVGIVLLLASSPQPAKVLEAFLTVPMADPSFFSQLMERSSLILLCAIGFSITFRTGAFNLGGPGQVAIGALAAVLACRLWPGLPIPLSVIFGAGWSAAVAGSFGAAMAVLKHKLQISEVLTGVFLSVAAIPLVQWILDHALPTALGTVQSTIIPSQFFLPLIPSSYPISSGIIASLGAAILTWFFLRHSLYGYDSRAISSNSAFAKTQGVPLGRRLVLSFVLSAAFHGLAGATMIYGLNHQANLSQPDSIAWAGIAAALLGKAHPLVAIPTSLVVAYVYIGAQAASAYSPIAAPISLIMEGLFLLLVSARTLGASRA